MDKLEFIKLSLKSDLDYWKKASEKEPTNSYYQGAISALECLEIKLGDILEEQLNG